MLLGVTDEVCKTRCFMCSRNPKVDKYLSNAVVAFIEFCILLAILGAIICLARNAVAQDYSSILERCEPYREQVQDILEEEGVCIDYYYLMVAESRCTEQAISDKGAHGFWQLIPATSKHYGCDDPHELECATRAAAKYIKHLQESFSTFEDVIRAYNMGGHNYQKYGATRQANGLVMVVSNLKIADKS